MEITQDVLRPGDRIKVNWGKFGTVQAIVTNVSINGKIYAKRWRKVRGYTQERNIILDEQGNYVVAEIHKKEGVAAHEG